MPQYDVSIPACVPCAIMSIRVCVCRALSGSMVCVVFPRGAEILYLLCLQLQGELRLSLPFWWYIRTVARLKQTWAIRRCFEKSNQMDSKGTWPDMTHVLRMGRDLGCSLLAAALQHIARYLGCAPFGSKLRSRCHRGHCSMLFLGTRNVDIQCFPRLSCRTHPWLPSDSVPGSKWPGGICETLKDEVMTSNLVTHPMPNWMLQWNLLANL